MQQKKLKEKRIFLKFKKEQNNIKKMNKYLPVKEIRNINKSILSKLKF